MGYESKVIIVERVEFGSGHVAGIEVAQVNMCKMGYGNGFHELFDTPIDFDLYGMDDEPTREDEYGDHCGMTNIGTLVDWLREAVEHDDYRRLKPLLGLLEGFDVNQWNDELVAVHYGY